jgi:hypothetical protein
LIQRITERFVSSFSWQMVVMDTNWW